MLKNSKIISRINALLRLIELTASTRICIIAKYHAGNNEGVCEVITMHCYMCLSDMLIHINVNFFVHQECSGNAISLYLLHSACRSQYMVFCSICINCIIISLYITTKMHHISKLFWNTPSCIKVNF